MTDEPPCNHGAWWVDDDDVGHCLLCRSTSRDVLDLGGIA